MPLLEVRDLVRDFGAFRAVDKVNFSVNPGDILGFIGPNGAGKSTTLRMITGYLTPTSGQVLIDGKDTMEQSLQVKERIGYLPERAPVYSDMSVFQFLSFAAEIRGFNGKKRRQSVEDVIEKCFLQQVAYQQIATLSKGYRQRTCFAQSVLHDPAVLILDEPTDGMDPNQKHEIRKVVKQFGEEKAIIISTHILEEVDALCDKVVVLRRGEVVANESIEEFRKRDKNMSSTFRKLTLGEAEEVVW